MANEIKDNAFCEKCKYFKYTGYITGFCDKRKIATKKNAVCGKFCDV